MKMEKPKLVVVGNGMAGVRAIEELLKLAPDLYDITIFGAEPHPNYNRILLSPVLAGEQTISDIVLNDLVAWAHTTGRVFIKSDGTPWRPIVHIRDIVAAAIAALEAPQDAIHNQTFNVGRTEENFRIRELADIVAETVPGCRIEYAAEGGPDKRCYRISCEKVGRMLPNFRPQWTARKGAQELYDAYRAAGLTFEDLERGRYARIHNIQRRLKAGDVDASLRPVRHAEAELASQAAIV